jgi:hypothetical protein
VTWDLQRDSKERIGRPEWNGQPEFVRAGTYNVSLTLGDLPPQKQKLVVRLAPGTADPGF